MKRKTKNSSLFSICVFFVFSKKNLYFLLLFHSIIFSLLLNIYKQQVTQIAQRGFHQRVWCVCASVCFCVYGTHRLVLLRYVFFFIYLIHFECAFAYHKIKWLPVVFFFSLLLLLFLLSLFMCICEKRVKP